MYVFACIVSFSTLTHPFSRMGDTQPKTVHMQYLWWYCSPLLFFMKGRLLGPNHYRCVLALEYTMSSTPSAPSWKGDYLEHYIHTYGGPFFFFFSFHERATTRSTRRYVTKTPVTPFCALNWVWPSWKKRNLALESSVDNAFVPLLGKRGTLHWNLLWIMHFFLSWL